jgi:hypothetical protein
VVGAGVVQLVGGINFTLAAGSEISMPGSLIIDDNDPGQYDSETPEPASLATVGGGLLLAGLASRRLRRK